jgi:signal transduction histidine kinase
VRDTGYGVPDDQQERLFSPFFRARTTETRFIEGTGLGLHLVKNIILRHEGEMMFESVYGKGSVFGFDIPLAGKKLLDDTKPKRP